MKPKPRGGRRCSDLSVSPAAGVEVMRVQMQLEIEGLEKCTGFIVTGSVKLASEPRAEITWL